MRLNITKYKPAGSLYHAFCRAFIPTDEMTEYYFGGKYFRHFYGDYYQDDVHAFPRRPDSDDVDDRNYANANISSLAENGWFDPDLLAERGATASTAYSPGTGRAQIPKPFAGRT